MDVQVLAIIVGLSAVAIGVAFYLVSRLSLFSKTPKEGLPLSNAEFQLTGASYAFYGLMAICMMGSVWAVHELELQGKAGVPPYFQVLTLEILVFAALYFVLQSLGISFKKKRK